MRYESYEDDILKTFKSIDASLKTIAKSLQSINTTVDIDNDSEETEEMKDDN